MMTNETQTKYPTHTVYTLKEKEGQEKPDWIKVGAAWEHGDQDGMNIILNILGQDVTVTVRKNKPKSE